MEKETLVLIPGTLCNERLWESQVIHLQEIADVHIGNIFQDDSIEGMASRILKETKGDFFLAGLSLGGMVAIEIMKQAPERVKKLALLDTNPEGPTQKQIETWERFINLSENGQFNSITKDYLLPGLLSEQNQTLEKQNIVIQMANEVGKETMKKQMTALTHRPNVKNVLQQIKIPTLVIVGENDITCPPSMSEEIARNISKSELKIIKNAGHLVTLEEPNEVSKLLKSWLMEDFKETI